MTCADIRHLFGGACRLVVDFPPTDPLGDEALVRIADGSGVVAHRAIGENVEDMLGRHLFQNRSSRSLMRRIRTFVARCTIVEILRNSRALRLRSGANAPHDCRSQHEKPHERSENVHGAQDYRNLTEFDGR